ncbi:MAG: hypothetical protein M3281_08755 [Chloroflexota bacterium]|nr:hypothetical protein [Chloroflexota bacterium]
MTLPVVREGTVVSATPLTEGATQLVLQVDARIAQSAVPGRFVLAVPARSTDPYLPRPLWVRRQRSDRLALVVQRGARGCEWLAASLPGATVHFIGPVGRSFDLPPRTGHLLIGCDVAGLNAALSLVDAAAERAAVSLIPLGIDATALAPALPPDVELLGTLDATALAWADAFYCIASPRDVQRAFGVLRSTTSRVPAFGVPQVPYACGVGVCGGCGVETREGVRLSCVDGPAFPLRELR